MSDRQHSPRAVIGGASGLIGTALKDYLAAHGWRVAPLVRRSPRPGTAEIHWNPDAGEIDARAIDGANVVVSLGGENVAAKRWSAARKAAIRDSRLVGTRLLSRTLAQLERPPGTFISASAIGYYGHRGDERLTEDSPPGSGFLPELCQAWEAATEPARQAGVRVVHPRIGVVLSRRGGALKRMLPPFRAGLGGVLGSGRQYVSWISLTDLVGALGFLIAATDVAGPVNASAPNAVTNREFTRTLGRVLRRPTVFPVPSLAIRAIYGEMGRALLLEGNRAYPAKLAEAGFRFEHPELEGALRFELGVSGQIPAA